MDVFEAMETCRAMRYLKPDPIPVETLEKILYAATRASNPGNSQGWAFVVVRDADKRRRIKQAIIDGVGGAIANTADAMNTGTNPVENRTMRGAQHLVQNFDRAPVLVLVCSRICYPPHAPSLDMVWCTVYPAAQNLIVAARALGIGSVFTTFSMQAGKALHEICGIPEDVVVGNIIPLGYPERAFGPVARKPLAEVVHYDTWGQRAMKSDFWLQRWRDQQIGFHQAKPNPWIERHWASLGLAPDATVFVPLCGKSLDMRALAELGHTVIGVELSPIGVAAFFDEAGEQADVDEGAALPRHAAGRISIYQGDFFALGPSEVAGVSAVFDRAAQIALPPDMRRRYAQHLCEILPSGTRTLLIALEYDQSLVDGPPFCVSQAEIGELYGAHATIEEIEAKEVRDLPPKFGEMRGVLERGYKITLG